MYQEQLNAAPNQFLTPRGRSNEDTHSTGVVSVVNSINPDSQSTYTRQRPTSDVSQRQPMCLEPPAATTRVFIDTETFGLLGIPFLLQFQIDGESEITVIHVFERTPAAVLELLEALSHPSIQLVGHNLSFDLTAISKLATVASMVNDWSFESIWEAERLWRGEVTYEERLQQLKLVYPGSVEDTMLAAMSLPPLEEQFLKSPGIHLKAFPVAVLPELEQIISKALTARPSYSDVPHAPDVGALLQSKVDGVTNRGDRELIQAAQARQDYNVLRKATIFLKKHKSYSLKNVARLLGFPGEITNFDFLDDFGRMPKEICPTIRDKDLARRLFDFIVKRQHEPQLLEYARRDVEMTKFLHAHYVQKPGYANLTHNFEVLPFMANLRLYGVHVDPERVATTQNYYKTRVEGCRDALKGAGLANFNSDEGVVRFVNKLLKQYLGGASAAKGLITNMKEETLRQTITQFEDCLGADHSATGLMLSLIRARCFSKRSTFLENVVGDTLYPEFSIKGTQTDRMTSSNPSIQQMPARSTSDEDEDGIKFRSVFTAPAGYELLVGDFDQFEMRLVSAVAQEPALIQAFNNNVDTHSLTALRVAGPQIRASDPSLATTTDEDLLQLLVTKDPRVKRFRSLGKTLNFAILYGSTEHGIAHQAGTTIDEAREMMAAFHLAYPALSNHVQAVHASLTCLQTKLGHNGYPRHQLIPARATRIANRQGVTRSFELPLRIIEILSKLGMSDRIGNYLPILNRPMSACVHYYDEWKTPAQVVQSQLRAAARDLQAYVHRQAYNFLIQSLGAYHTKQLQVALAKPFFQPGIQRAADLMVLPGINVHDEIHMYVRTTPDAIQQIASEYVHRVSGELGVPIKFAFERIESWADKG